MDGSVRVVSTIASGPDAPSFRVRSLLMREELRRHGVDVESAPILSREEYEAFQHASAPRRGLIAWTGRRRLRRVLEGSDAEVAVIHRSADYLPSLRVERTAARGRRLIYDIDDAVWLSGRITGGHPLAILKGARRKTRWLASNASHVIAGNDILAEWVSRFAERVTVVPSVVETRDVPPRRHESRDEVVLGWIGSRTTASYLDRLREPLAQAARALGDIRLRLVTVGGAVSAIPGVRVSSEPWSPETERRVLALTDIGLMPLPDNEWARGKCAYKALQYMAWGVPVVADDVGITAGVVGDGYCGFVAKGEDDWTDAVGKLAREAETREQLGGNGRARVERDYSVVRWAPTTASILRGADPAPRPSPAHA